MTSSRLSTRWARAPSFCSGTRAAGTASRCFRRFSPGSRDRGLQRSATAGRLVRRQGGARSPTGSAQPSSSTPSSRSARRSRQVARRWPSSSTPTERSRHLWSGVRRASSSPRLRSDLGRACPSRATASFVTGARAAAHARRCLAAGGRYGRGAWAGPQPLVVEATCGPGTEPCSSANGLKLCMPTGGVCCYFSPKTRRCFGLLKGGAGVCCCSGHRVISACATANTTSRAAGASPPRARERGSAGRSAAARARCARTPRRAPAAGGGATACCWKPPPDANAARTAGASPPRARERGSAGRSAAARARCARTPRRAPAPASAAVRTARR